MIQLFDFVLISGFAIISVIVVMLWLSKKRQLPQKLLIAILSLILIIIVTLYAHIHGLRTFFMIINLIEDGARFLIAPLLYIYIKSIFVKEESLIKNHLPHFIPFLLFFMFFSIPRFIDRIYGEYIVESLNFYAGPSHSAIVKDFYVLIYFFLSVKLLGKFKKKMKSNYSSFELMNSGWLNRLLVGFLIVALFDLLLIAYRNIFQPALPWNIGLLSLCILIFITIYLGFQGLKQTKVYLPEFLIDSESENRSEVNGNMNSIVNHEEFQILKTRLDEVMTKEQPYLLQELTLNMLAEKLETTDKKLSVVLNQYMDISFYDFINQYRIEEVKQMLASKGVEKYSLLGVAYTCGFNSKSSFYRAFKKETGISPTEYKKRIVA